MTARLLIAAALLLSTSGCVAIPLVAQLATGATSASQLCSMAKIPGQASLCDRIPFAQAPQPAGKPTAMR